MDAPTLFKPVPVEHGTVAGFGAINVAPETQYADTGMVTSTAFVAPLLAMTNSRRVV